VCLDYKALGFFWSQISPQSQPEFSFITSRQDNQESLQQILLKTLTFMLSDQMMPPDKASGLIASMFDIV